MSYSNDTSVYSFTSTHYNRLDEKFEIVITYLATQGETEDLDTIEVLDVECFEASDCVFLSHILKALGVNVLELPMMKEKIHHHFRTVGIPFMENRQKTINS